MKSLSDGMDGRRRLILAGVVAGFALAQTAMILDRVLAPGHWIHIVLIILSLAGWLIFGLEAVSMVKTGRIIRREPDVELALNDEFVRAKRGRAMAAAFWVVMAFQAVILVLSLFIRLDAGLAAQATLTVGVIGVIGWFLYYDREDGDA